MIILKLNIIRIFSSSVLGLIPVFWVKRNGNLDKKKEMETIRVYVIFSPVSVLVFPVRFSGFR